jgi:DNA-binding protein H-NS
MEITRQELKIAISQCDKEIELNKSNRAILVKQETEMLERDRASELPALLAKIEELGLNASDLGLLKPKKNKNSLTPTDGNKKYRNPVTGEEWSGRGGRPNWIRDKNKALFLNPKWAGTSETANVNTSVSHSNSLENSNFTSAVDQISGPVIKSDDGSVTNSPIEEAKNNVIELGTVPVSDPSHVMDTFYIPAINSIAGPSPSLDRVPESVADKVVQAT